MSARRIAILIDGGFLLKRLPRLVKPEFRATPDKIASCIPHLCRKKGVDMRIGLDIAALALKKQADTLVLVAGDSDFIPAAKLARREGIDFILDPLWQQINADLFEHIDGLYSGFSKPRQGNGGAGTGEIPATPEHEHTDGP